jgi:hypothetical protein
MAWGRFAAPPGPGDEPEQPMTVATSRPANAKANERGKRGFSSKREFTVDLNAGPDFCERTPKL